MMGLDVGERRIGVAIADELGMIASPLLTVPRGDGDLGALRDLAVSRGVTRLVVGLPTGLSGREGPQAAIVRAFADALEEAVGPDIAVAFWDERLTTTVAERALRGRRTRRDRRKGEVDAMAAAVILQGYLDACRARAVQRGEHDGGKAR
ncbi:MAG: Holliday junction resolvase RuvX [Thermomicrobiales bacterium]